MKTKHFIFAIGLSVASSVYAEKSSVVDLSQIKFDTHDYLTVNDQKIMAKELIAKINSKENSPKIVDALKVDFPVGLKNVSNLKDLFTVILVAGAVNDEDLSVISSGNTYTILPTSMIGNDDIVCLALNRRRNALESGLVFDLKDEKILVYDSVPPKKPLLKAWSEGVTKPTRKGESVASKELIERIEKLEQVLASYKELEEKLGDLENTRANSEKALSEIERVMISKKADDSRYGALVKEDIQKLKGSVEAIQPLVSVVDGLKIDVDKLQKELSETKKLILQDENNKEKVVNDLSVISPTVIEVEKYSNTLEKSMSQVKSLETGMKDLGKLVNEWISFQKFMQTKVTRMESFYDQHQETELMRNYDLNGLRPYLSCEYNGSDLNSNNIFLYKMGFSLDSAMYNGVLFKTFMIMPYDNKGNKLLRQPYIPDNWAPMHVGNKNIEFRTSFAYELPVEKWGIQIVGFEKSGRKVVVDGVRETFFDSSLTWQRFNIFGKYALEVEKNLVKATMALSQAVKLNGHHPDLRFNLGNAYADRGMLEEAEREYTIGVDMDPTDADMLYALGHIKVELGARKMKDGSQLPDSSFGKSLVYGSVWNQTGVRDERFMTESARVPYHLSENGLVMSNRATNEVQSGTFKSKAAHNIKENSDEKVVSTRRSRQKDDS